MPDTEAAPQPKSGVRMEMIHQDVVAQPEDIEWEVAMSSGLQVTAPIVPWNTSGICQCMISDIAMQFTSSRNMCLCRIDCNICPDNDDVHDTSLKCDILNSIVNAKRNAAPSM